MEVTDNKITAPGFEKFSTVQDILEQNKCVHFCSSLTQAHQHKDPETDF